METPNIPNINEHDSDKPSIHGGTVSGETGKTGDESKSENTESKKSGIGNGEQTMRWRSSDEKLKARKRIRKLRRFPALILIIITLMILTDSSLRKPLRELAAGKARAVSAEALNDAVLKVLDESGFDKLCALNLLADEKNGDVYTLKINSPAMNRIAANIAHEAQETIRLQGKLGLSIPLGTATGIAFLTGLGPKIKVTFTPIGSVTSRISTKFSGAGINQTRYCAYLNLEAKVHVVLGTSQDTVVVNHTAALYETIIVGAVPETYTNIDSVDEALNLLPVN